MTKRTVILVVGLLVAQSAFLAVWWWVERGRTHAPRQAVETVQISAIEELDVPLNGMRTTTVGGRTVELSEPSADGVVLHFWATWCGPCVDEIPKFLERARGSRTPAVAIAVDDDPASLEEFFDGDVPDEVVVEAPELVKKLGVRQLPQTIYVDSEGMARTRWTGARDWTSTEWRDLQRVTE